MFNLAIKRRLSLQKYFFIIDTCTNGNKVNSGPNITKFLFRLNRLLRYSPYTISRKFLITICLNQNI